MKAIPILLIIFLLVVPIISLGQSFQEITPNISRIMNLFTELIDISEKIFSLFQHLWEVIYEWVTETFNINLKNIVRELIRVIIDILDLFIRILKAMVP